MRHVVRHLTPELSVPSGVEVVLDWRNVTLLNRLIHVEGKCLEQLCHFFSVVHFYGGVVATPWVRDICSSLHKSQKYIQLKITSQSFLNLSEKYFEILSCKSGDSYHEPSVERRIVIPATNFFVVRGWFVIHGLNHSSEIQKTDGADHDV